MANKRVQDFRRKQAQRSAAIDSNQVTLKQSAQLDTMYKMILGMAGRLYQVENQVKSLFPTAKIADWRSLAMMKVITEAGVTGFPLGEFEIRVLRRAVELQVENFEIESAEDDKKKNLETVTEGVAENGTFAIVHIKVFKGGKELEEQQIVRSKIELGTQEMFPELDTAILGMKIGETKRFPLNLMGQTDEAEVVLHGLRKRKVVETKESVNGSEQKQSE